MIEAEVEGGLELVSEFAGQGEVVNPLQCKVEVADRAEIADQVGGVGVVEGERQGVAEFAGRGVLESRCEGPGKTGSERPGEGVGPGEVGREGADGLLDTAESTDAGDVVRLVDGTVESVPEARAWSWAWVSARAGSPVRWRSSAPTRSWMYWRASSPG